MDFLQTIFKTNIFLSRIFKNYIIKGQTYHPPFHLLPDYFCPIFLPFVAPKLIHLLMYLESHDYFLFCPKMRDKKIFVLKIVWRKSIALLHRLTQAVQRANLRRTAGDPTWVNYNYDSIIHFKLVHDRKKIVYCTIYTCASDFKIIRCYLAKYIKDNQHFDYHPVFLLLAT